MEIPLETRWMQVAQTLANQTLAKEDVYIKWWNKITELCDSKERHCYDLQYIEWLFDLYDEHYSSLQSPEAVALALFFQYLHYDAHEHGIDKRKVINTFHEFSKDINLFRDSDLARRVDKLLHAAINNCTEVHLLPGKYGDEDVHFFLDFDTAILGARKNAYQRFANKMRKEYHTLRHSQYAKLRLQILHGFLQVPNIFATRPFRDLYEEQARKNIREEIEELRAHFP